MYITDNLSTTLAIDINVEYNSQKSEIIED